MSSRGSKSGQGLKVAKKGRHGVRAGLKLGRNPVEKCLPHGCVQQGPRKGPPLARQVWGNPENPSRLGCNLLCLAWSLSGAVECPAPSGRVRAPARCIWRREGSELFPSIHLHTLGFLVFFPSESPLGRVLICRHRARGTWPSPRAALGRSRGCGGSCRGVGRGAWAGVTLGEWCHSEPWHPHRSGR